MSENAQKAQGFIEKVTKNAPGYYSFKLAGGSWYQTGTKEAPPGEGSNVSFVYNKVLSGMNPKTGIPYENLTVEKGTLALVAQETPATHVTGNVGAALVGVGGGDRQKAIQYQSARRDAITAVGLAVNAEFFPLKNAAGKKATDNEKYDVFLAAIDRLTFRFATDNDSFRVLEEYKAIEGELADNQDG